MAKQDPDGLARNGRKGAWERRLDFAAGLVWGGMAVFYLTAGVHNRNLVAVGLGLFYVLIAWSFLARRPAQRTGAWWEWLLGVVAVCYPLTTGPGTPLASPVPGLLLQGLGLGGMLAAMLALGRSFGIAPADRGLVTGGLYRRLRHPLYATELLFNLGVVAGALSVRNLAAYLVLVAIQVIRIAREERIIAGYPAYAGQVRWRLLPYVW